MNDWIGYIPKMSFTMAKDNTITFEVTDEMRQVQRKWEKVSAEEVRKKEAAKYGIALADLDKHKKYLAAKEQKASARTSADMKKAERGFAGIKGYLDSDELEKACAAAGAELKAKEEEEARIRREREEARRREEAERLRRAVEAYEKQVEEINKAKADYIAAENARIEKEYSDALAAAKAGYDAECAKNSKETEDANAEKTRLEQELEKAGLLAFGKKKQLRLDIEAIGEKLRQLSSQKSSIDREYEAEQRRKKNARDNAAKNVPVEAEKKFVLPKDPRK